MYKRGFIGASIVVLIMSGISFAADKPVFTGDWGEKFSIRKAVLLYSSGRPILLLTEAGLAISSRRILLKNVGNRYEIIVDPNSEGTYIQTRTGQIRSGTMTTVALRIFVRTPEQKTIWHRRIRDFVGPRDVLPEVIE